MFWPFASTASNPFAERLEKETTNWWTFNPAQSPGMRELQAATREEQVGFVLFVLREIAGVKAPSDWKRKYILEKAAGHLLKSKFPLGAEEALAVLRALLTNSLGTVLSYPWGSLLKNIPESSMTPEVFSTIMKFRSALDSHPDNAKARKLVAMINARLEGKAEPEIKPGGGWSKIVFADLDGQTAEDQTKWRRALRHATLLTQSTPTKKWLEQAQTLVAAIEADVFTRQILQWLALGPTAGKAGEPASAGDADYQKGMIWFLSLIDSPEVNSAIADFGILCLRKIPNVGAVSHRAGNACIAALASCSSHDAVPQLVRMRSAVKYRVARQLIEKGLQQAAQKAGLSQQELEDSCVPDFGLDAERQIAAQLGEHRATIRITGSTEVSLLWNDGKGKALKSVPAEVKRAFSQQLKQLNKTRKDLEKMLAAQRVRLEDMLATCRPLTLNSWQENFVHHPLLSDLCRRLIWKFEDDAAARLGIWREGGVVEWNNQPVDLRPEIKVRLWHPMESGVQTILSWRCWLEDHELVQPFKQAHREVYLLTDAERQTETYSNRFAGHVLRQHQMASLCRERGWEYRLQGGGFDGANYPVKRLPDGYVIEYWVQIGEDRDEAMTGSGINLYVVTDQVRFFRNGNHLRLVSVPPLVFSEAMRDVDLFVGVCSIGNDPNWNDRGDASYGRYWHDYAFGELSQSARTRREILERLLPKLKIAGQCRIEERFLVVSGKRCVYKIHLGSGNIQMEPGSRYLCIVPGSFTKSENTSFLPFEGDHTLAVILSKAFMLAEDTKIKDPTILRQLPPI